MSTEKRTLSLLNVFLNHNLKLKRKVCWVLLILIAMIMFEAVQELPQNISVLLRALSLNNEKYSYYFIGWYKKYKTTLSTA